MVFKNRSAEVRLCRLGVAVGDMGYESRQLRREAQVMKLRAGHDNEAKHDAVEYMCEG